MLIRPGAIIFYIVIIIINIFYLSKINNKNYVTKIIYSFVLSIILFSPFLVNISLNNKIETTKENNNYFSIHAISSLISKQKKFDLIPNLYFECIIFPAINIVLNNDPQIKNFFKSDYSKDLNKKILILYVKNFIKRPSDFLLISQQCFFANSLIINILTKKEINEVEKILSNPFINFNDKIVVNSFLENSKNYSSVAKQTRFIAIFLFITTLISLIISIKSILSNKNDKFAILSIIFFIMYYLIVILHTNLLYIQTRWFFTYYPLLIFSNLKSIELASLFIKKFKFK